MKARIQIIGDYDEYSETYGIGPLPCPFCGYDEGPDVVNAYIASQQITMKKCVCRCCKACTGLSTSEEGARKKWNTRANDKAQVSSEAR